jgi:tetratricopeptide (TPR) repeat protein
MVRPPAKLAFVLLALGLWILACPASWAEDNDANALNQQVKQLIEQGKYQEAIPIAKRALEVAKRARGSEHPETTAALNNLGLLFLTMGSFIQAGAQNLLMTLWPISDEVTVQIMSDFYEAAHTSGNAPEALAKVQRDWLVKLRKEQGLASAVNLAGRFIMSSQGNP